MLVAALESARGVLAVLTTGPGAGEGPIWNWLHLALELNIALDPTTGLAHPHQRLRGRPLVNLAMECGRCNLTVCAVHATTAGAGASYCRMSRHLRETNILYDRDHCSTTENGTTPRCKGERGTAL